MKKVISLACAAGLVAAAFLVPANAAGSKQSVTGTIAAPARHPDGCYTGLSRHLWSLGGEQANGVVGYTFDVNKATWGQPFTLKATGGLGPKVDLDLSYYLGDFHSREEWLNDPAPAAPATYEFETHKGSGEKGRVPKLAVKAVVCVYASEAGAAVGVPFSYKAGR